MVEAGTLCGDFKYGSCQKRKKKQKETRSVCESGELRKTHAYVFGPVCGLPMQTSSTNI